MDLLTHAAGWLADTLAASAGVAVGYTRPPAVSAVPLTAVVAGGRTDLSQPGQPPVWVVTTDRDYLFRLADLAAAGLYPPAEGDRVTETINGTAATFVASRRPNEPVWEWGEPERQTVRVRCVPAKP